MMKKILYISYFIGACTIQTSQCIPPIIIVSAIKETLKFIIQPNRPLETEEEPTCPQLLIRGARQIASDCLKEAIKASWNYLWTSHENTRYVNRNYDHIYEQPNNADDSDLATLWQQIRNDDEDVYLIAQNITWPVQRISELKQALFFNIAVQPQLQIINHWHNLKNNTQTQEDINWLSHLFFQLNLN